jgi:hypothetical protein
MEAICVSFAFASAAAGAVARSAIENASHSQIEQTPLQVKTAEALTSGPLRRQGRVFAVMATLVPTVTAGHEPRRTAETIRDKRHPGQDDEPCQDEPCQDEPCQDEPCQDGANAGIRATRV